MSRKSVSRRSSRSPVPTIEEPNSDEQRLDLSNIVQMDPWKDIDKYDKEEVGQIQEILVQFNNMVVGDKKNKRRSVGKRSTKSPSGNEALEEESTKEKETIKNDKKQRYKSESSASITNRENVATDETSEIQNTKEKSEDKNEDELEERKEKSIKSKNHVELDVPLNDKKNKRISEGKRPATSSTKATGINAGLEEKTMKTQKIRDDKRQSCIIESSVNDTSIDILENVSTKNASHNQNLKGKPVEKDEFQHEEKKEKSSKSRNSVEFVVELNDKNNKRKSVGKSGASTSSTKATGSNAGFEDKTKKKENMRNDAVQHWISESSVNDATISVPENVATKDTSDNQNTVDKKTKEIYEENNDLSSKVINRVERRSLGKRLYSGSAKQTIASNNSTEGQSTMNKGKFQYWLLTSEGAGSIVDAEENIDLDHKRDNVSIESFDEEKICTQKHEEIRGNTVPEAVVEKIVVTDDTFTARMQEISKLVSPTPSTDKESYMETIEFHRDEPSCDDNIVNNDSIISGHLRNQRFQVLSSANTIEKLESDSNNRKNNDSKRDANSAKQSSTMKPRSVSEEPERRNIAEYTDNKYESKHTLHPGSEKTSLLKKEADEHPVKQSSTMKARSASAEPDYEKFIVCNNNEFESKRAKKREEKIAKAFEKFGKKFAKYSSKAEKPQNRQTGPNDVTLDSESDSDSSDCSSSSSSESDESSSSEYTSSSSTCSCCSESSSDSSYSTNSRSASCSCASCCDDDMYSEYTLASSSSTHPGSDDSTDSSSD